MNFKNYSNISIDVKNQIDRIREIWSDILDSDFLGMYIHGSIALECFKEGVSDIDILIVCRARIARSQKISLAKAMIDADLCPCPLEMSAIQISDLNPWRHPAICQFHYSDSWTEQYKQVVEDNTKKCFILDNEFEDADIACHVKLTKQCGIKIYGADIDEVFPDIPEEDFWKSISADIDNYNFDAYKPKYFSSNILILGRILSYKKEGCILSKYHGGLWMLDHIPKQYRYIVENAICVWYEKGEPCDYDSKDLNGLKKFLINEIK